MSKHFTPCPACGAVGEVNSTCQFCGTTILLKEGIIPSDARVIKQRTVTPQQYAEKVSIYHNVENINDKLIKVCIGNQIGIINLNGDLIFPLGNFFDIERGPKEHIIKVYKEGKYDFSFFNLETMEEAEPSGFIQDKENLERILRVVDVDDWTAKEFKNIDGTAFHYDYFEEVKGEGIYFFYKGKACFLGTPWEGVILEEVKSFGDCFESKNKKYIPVERLNGETINLPTSYRIKEGDDWEWYEDEELIVEWCKQTNTPIPPFLEVQLTESKKDVETEKDVISETKNSSSQEGHKSLIGIEDFLKGVLYIILLSLSLLFVRWISGE